MLLTLLLGLLAPHGLAQQTAAATKSFDIPAQSGDKALKQFAAQSGLDVVYGTATAAKVSTHAVKGDYAPRDAIDLLLRDTGLIVVQDSKTGALTVSLDPNGSRLALKNSDQPLSKKTEVTDSGAIKLDTFEVFGRKTLNMGIRRTRDDAQPYVIFDREQVANSGATELNEFLKQRLTMNATARSNEQQLSLNGATTQINLRGLGAGQTLILIDGHRVAGFQNSGQMQQADLNSIPISTIERIEILPTTASGIYGGSATGGVVNVVLRRDYAGAELTLGYGNTFDTDVANRTATLSAGFNWENGKTNMLVTGSWTASNELRARDTDVETLGRARILANNPAFYLSSATPPAGGTPNIRSSNGSNLVLKNGTTLNSPITFIPVGYAGPAGDGGTALVANAGKYNFSLAPSAESAGGGGAGLISTPTRKTASAMIRREFSKRFEAFLDFAASDSSSIMATSSGSGSFSLPVNAPNNPFTTAITVQTGSAATDGAFMSRQRDYRLIGGATMELSGNWKLGADFSWTHDKFSRQNQPSLLAGAGTAVALGTPDIMRDLVLHPIDLSPFITAITTPPVESDFYAASLRTAGPVWTLPAGDAVVSNLVEYREEQLSDQTTNFIASGSTSYVPPRSQSVRSAYAEARVPLLSQAQKLPFVQLLELQAAVRYDEYTLTGTPSTAPLGSTYATVTTKRRSIDETIGLRYEPLPSIGLRGSFGTGFVPPSTRQLIASPFTLSISGLVDPKRGNTPLAATGTSSSGSPIIDTMSGGSPSLKPEESKSWSGGLVLTPGFLPGLRLSIDYTRIQKRDNITTLTPQAVINNEDYFPGRIRRGPVPAGDSFGVGPITFIDFTSVNISQSDIEAYDLALDYTLPKREWGKLEVFGAATLQTRFRTQLTPTLPVVDSVGVGDPNGVAGSPPLRLKANGGITWTRGSWSVGWVSRYFSNYQVSANAVQILNQGNGGRVPSQIYHDASIRYRFGQSAGPRWRMLLFERTELHLVVKNVFNQRPPLDTANTNFLYSYFGDPRLASYQLTLKKAF